MGRISLITLLFTLLSCGNDVQKGGAEGGLQTDELAKSFPEASLPYEISDTALINNRDTSRITDADFISLVPDSLTTALFGKSASVKYTPLGHSQVDKEKVLVVKAYSGKKTAALLFIFEENGAFAAAFPLLVPDTDPSTTQSSSVDKSFSISRSISKKVSEDEVQEGKNVYAYNRNTKLFDLIIEDVLDNSSLELINPIDTLAKTDPRAGDYVQGKKNLVSLRDGRNAKELQFFIHIEKEGGCTGELKGTALFTSSKTAVYRQGGDPCVLELHFSSGTVTLKEIEGCGSHRNIDCAFDGKYTRKKSTESTTGSGATALL